MVINSEIDCDECACGNPVGAVFILEKPAALPPEQQPGGVSQPSFRQVGRRPPMSTTIFAIAVIGLICGLGLIIAGLICD